MNADLKQYSPDGWRREPTPVVRPEGLEASNSASDPSRRVHELECQISTLRAALDSRDTIGMAKGILMAREGCTPDEAFDILRRASQRENRKLADLAAELVASNAQRAVHPPTVRPA
ncbi:MAG TPA: ANTAR domain-containing protein [Acidimicrobiales bacterium]|nr:ANTAR domain-containing protein [Acidimicrobiales bacterium]